MEYTETLTKNELELIEIIRTSEDPVKALETAFNVIVDYIQREEQGKWEL